MKPKPIFKGYGLLVKGKIIFAEYEFNCKKPLSTVELEQARNYPESEICRIVQGIGTPTVYCII